MKKNGPHADSIFGFGDNLTLVSYIPKSKPKTKKKKNVLLVSSMHHEGKIDQDTDDEKKLEIITFYNATKGGVDVVDMIMDKYSVSRNSRRWLLTLFFALLNISCEKLQIHVSILSNIYVTLLFFFLSYISFFI